MLALLTTALLWLSSAVGTYPPHMTTHPAARARELAIEIQRASEVTGEDPLLLLALAYHESRFDASAVSPAGAFGLFQELPKFWGRSTLQVCLSDPSACLQWQATGGAIALAHYRRKCGNTGRALTAYRRGFCGPPGPEAKKVLQTRAALRVRFGQ